jgi:hypothetical protein
MTIGTPQVAMAAVAFPAIGMMLVAATALHRVAIPERQ